MRFSSAPMEAQIRAGGNPPRWRFPFTAATISKTAGIVFSIACFVVLATLLSGDISSAATSAVHHEATAFQLASGDLIDYDTDDDGLIEVGSLSMLNATRWDLDGNGESTDSGYSVGLPHTPVEHGLPLDRLLGLRTHVGPGLRH